MLIHHFNALSLYLSSMLFTHNTDSLSCLCTVCTMSLAPVWKEARQQKTGPAALVVVVVSAVLGPVSTVFSRSLQPLTNSSRRMAAKGQTRHSLEPTTRHTAALLGHPPAHLSTCLPACLRCLDDDRRCDRALFDGTNRPNGNLTHFFFACFLAFVLGSPLYPTAAQWGPAAPVK